jgi:hypothetical protein
MKQLWFSYAPTRVQMWVHRKFGYEWLPSKLVADRLPVSVLYWAFIRTGVKAIKGNEIVPEVKYMDVLHRIPVKKP